MDLSQSKLSKNEWINTEIPVSDNEMVILKLISLGFHNVNIKMNINMSLLQIMKIEYNPEIECYLYKKYFENDINDIIKKYVKKSQIDIIEIPKNIKTPKKMDLIRIQNMSSNFEQNKTKIFELIMINFCKNILKSIHEKTSDYAFYLYTIIHLKKCSITNTNIYVTTFVNNVINYANFFVTISDIIHKSYEFIEKNPYLLKYEDITLFQHQKQLFSICKNQPAVPKLILYIAPTGTGKTLSPIGLSENFRIIFICVARHVGLALAKSAISMNKKIGFAFGCETASDIRLHYFAASNYTINKRSGGIGKVDNSAGEKVEIMICDVKSYITAMHYMLAFNSEENIITYWDEPTITMDYETHELHETIHKNWIENRISKVVLSCATLPTEEEICDTIIDFKNRFDNAEIHTITSYDCKKTISILNKQNNCILPHLLFKDWNEMQSCVSYCNENKTLLRYFDLYEIIRFMEYIDKNNFVDDSYSINSYFNNIIDINMNSLKTYYLIIMKQISFDKWNEIFEHMTKTQIIKFRNTNNEISKIKSLDKMKSFDSKTQPISSTLTRHNSVDTNYLQSHADSTSSSNGILITTKDAHTLTDGPTIFLAEDINKIGNFYIQQSNIPSVILQNITDKIHHNNNVIKKIELLEKALDDKTGKSKDDDDSNKKDDKKVMREDNNPELRKLMSQLEVLREDIRMISLDPCYVPNTKQHQQIWVKDRIVLNAFVPNIDEETVKEIVMLDITYQQKLLLLLGIGMFEQTCNVEQTPSNIKYMEIMKKLAYEQKLYIIIASSDYIYGTNYQFCHGFIGKDLKNMTQQKIIQAMGRIGRNKIQQEYTVRFRDDENIIKLFTKMTDNLEARNMSKLFSC